MEFGKFNADMSLSNMGITSLKAVHYNLNESSLMQHALLRKEGELGLGGTLLVKTGKHTGRSPNDKYVVTTDGTLETIWWKKNGKLSPEKFNRLYVDMLKHMRGKEYFVQDLYACADPEFRLNVRVINELAWHGLFIRHLLRRPGAKQLDDYVPEFTIINCPSFKASPETYQIRSDTVIAINFEKKNNSYWRNCICR